MWQGYGGQGGRWAGEPGVGAGRGSGGRELAGGEDGVAGEKLASGSTEEIGGDRMRGDRGTGVASALLEDERSSRVRAIQHDDRQHAVGIGKGGGFQIIVIRGAKNPLGPGNG